MQVYDFYITPTDYEIASENNISAKTLEARIRDLGWNKERALNQEVRRKSDRKYWAKVAESNGISYNAFTNRVNAGGWDMERAATQPLQDKKKQIAYMRQKRMKYPREIVELAKSNGIQYRTFHQRVYTGWDMMKAATTPIMSASECGRLSKQANELNMRWLFPKVMS